MHCILCKHQVSAQQLSSPALWITLPSLVRSKRSRGERRNLSLDPYDCYLQFIALYQQLDRLFAPPQFHKDACKPAGAICCCFSVTTDWTTVYMYVHVNTDALLAQVDILYKTHCILKGQE